ncbi:NAD(P)/FAD-dependent oxidoreductase [Nitrosophilus kaiyonis]|uniref:NAD(P)/FAD-dependent oxidoreductase n=1 Tax=Nitrosophilus kaiyonis TaxID=2930200 RepID=UPI0024915334|nr:aminoacetone oxidase family FAD-binding enzyme [Nitrosophilus kaiyonis]
MKNYDIIILGAGASGLMCASFLKNSNFAIIEHNSDIGEKIKISGGGKCNITNRYLSPKNYLGDKDIIKNILDEFSNEDLLKWVKSKGCNLILKKERQYFCEKSSKDLINIFKKEIKSKNIFLNHEIKEVFLKNGVFTIKTDKNLFSSKILIVATGGLSYKKIGATDIGFEIAKKFNHKILPLKPALVGFTVQKEQFWFKNLSGISFRAKVKIKDKIFSDDILFTHKGISGPAILNASLYWDKGNIEIDFLNGKSLRNYLKNPNKIISTQLNLPKRFIKEFLKSINTEDKKVKDLTKEDVNKLNLLLNYKFAPAGTFGFERAEVTKGGVDTNELDNNLMSKKIKNLFFIGEVVNVTGELGGYNFQWAFSSAVKVARYLNSNIKKD